MPINNIFSQDNPALRQALKQLGSFYGLKGANEFVQILLSAATKSETGLSKPSAAIIAGQISGAGDTLENLSEAILALNGQGIFIDEFKKAIDDYMAPAFIMGPPISLSLSGGSTPGMQISALTGDPLVQMFNDDATCPISITMPNVPAIGKPYVRNYSVKQIIEYEGDIPESSKVSVIEMHHPNLAFANRDTMSAAIMLQAIPSIELSKCVPYFDCKVVIKSEVNPKDPSNENAVFANGISIYKFLHGEKLETQDTTIKQLVESIPVELMNPPPTLDGSVQGSDNPKPEQKIKLGTAGMELFTTPQTMVNGNLVYKDLDTTDNNYGPGVTVQDIPLENKVLDKFRPLMSFQSLQVDVTPASGMLATKSCKIKIKLHDKSRMHEIAPLIQPSGMQNNEILMEWGWSHPIGDASKSPYGALLNSMRVTEKYGVQNSSYTFTPEGQVDITLKLYTLGATNATFDLISTNQRNVHPIDIMKDLVLAIRTAMKDLKQQGYTMNSEMGAPDHLGKMGSVKGLLSLDEKQKGEIGTFISNMKSKASRGAKKNWEALSDSWQAAQSGTTGFHADLAKQFDRSIKILTSPTAESLTKDPYLCQFAAPSSGKYVEITTEKHVSFAKVLLTFVGQPLMETGRFDEIQLVFYPMNEYAMFARNLNVGQYPINKSVLSKHLLKELQKSPSLTIQRFLGLMTRLFISNMGDDIYGLSQFYKRDENGKSELLKEITEGDSAKKKKQEMSNTKQKVMEECYTKDGEKRFKKPRVQMWVECVKHAVDPGKSILRLHFYDAAATSYSGYAQLWQAASGNDMGMVGKYVSSKNKLDQKKKEQLPENVPKEKQQEYRENLEKREKRTTDYQAQATAQMEEFIELGLIEKIVVTGQKTNENMDGEYDKFRIRGGPDQIRGILARNMPTLKYGTEYSGILSAQLNTNQDPNMETIHMQRQGKGGHETATSFDSGLPLQVKPVTLSLETFGCPFINFGQQFFVDFQTNTSIDDIYTVSGVSHNLTPGEFKTSIKLMPINKTGQFRSLQDGFNEAVSLSKEIADNIGD